MLSTLKEKQNRFLKLINPNDKRFLVVISVIIGVVAGFLCVNPTKLSIGIPATLFFILLILLLAPLFTKKSDEKRLFVKLALAAFIVRMCVAFLLVSISLIIIKDPVGGYSFANDAYRYLNSANRIIEFFEQGGSILFLFGSNEDWLEVSKITNYFPWISTTISLMFGAYETLIAGSLYSAFMAALSVLMIYKMAQDLLPEEKKSVAIDAAILAIFFPSYIMFTSVMLKEATVIFLSYSMLYIFYRYIMSKKQHYLGILVGGLFVLATFRVYAAGIVLFACAAGYLIYVIRSRGAKNSVQALIVLSVLVIIVLVFGKKYLGIEFIMKVLDVENIQDLRTQHYGAASTFFEIGDLSTPTGILKAIPLGLCYMLLSPFPWQWIGGTDIVEKALAPDMIIYYIIFPSVLLGFYRVHKQKPLLGIILVVYFFTVALPYSILIGNFGTIYRLRMQLLPTMFVMAVLGGTPIVNWVYFFIKESYMRITKLSVPDNIFDQKRSYK